MTEHFIKPDVKVDCPHCGKPIEIIMGILKPQEPGVIVNAVDLRLPAEHKGPFDDLLAGLKGAPHDPH